MKKPRAKGRLRVLALLTVLSAAIAGLSLYLGRKRESGLDEQFKAFNPSTGSQS